MSESGRVEAFHSAVSRIREPLEERWVDTTMSVPDLEGISMSNNLDPSSKKIGGLAESIRETGVKERLQVEETRKGRLLTDGHHRLLAAKKAGLKHLPVRVYANTPEGRSAANRAMLGK